MKKILSVIIAVVISFLPLFTLNSLTVKAESNVLKICNWEDYIYKYEDSNRTLIDDFKDWYQDTYHTSIDVEYSTFGTNEIMYNELNINKSGNDYNYDLVCPSDYMIQKMISADMLEKFDTPINNYDTYASGFFKDLFIDNGWNEYSIGYMWGTMGYVYNPEFVSSTDIKNWSAIWNIDYKNQSTIKDSIRDSYFLGVAYVYRDELINLADELQINNITEEFYMQKLSEIFNRTDDETIAKVEKALTNVKSNIFGFEVDNGKNDMVTGKININFCWSGDAVYSMDEAEIDDVELYYSVPEEGSNIWFDGWVMPKGANKELAQIFLNYISMPEIAIKNMEYIGYTSAIAGDDVYDWVVENYSAEENAEITYDVDLSYFFDNISSEKTGHVITDTIGRQFSAQYPDWNTIKRCSVMQNFNEETLTKVNNMWDRVKGNTLATWLIILIVLIVIAIIIGVLLFILLKKNKFIGKSNKKYTVVKKN